MLMLLSPAKSLDVEGRAPTRRHTKPRLRTDTEELLAILKRKDVADLASLMHISDELAALNVERYADLDLDSDEGAKQAIHLFAGDVYRGLDVASFSTRDLTEAQKTVRILSGLHGLLRPLDLIHPYRLEMGTKLATDRGQDLYDFWGERITDLIAGDLEESPGAPVIVNLASVEYASAVDPKRLGLRFISPRFEDRDGRGKPRIVSFHAKRARGLMAAHLVRTRARNAARILEFAEEGYTLDESRSSADVPVFVR